MKFFFILLALKCSKRNCYKILSVVHFQFVCLLQQQQQVNNKFILNTIINWLSLIDLIHFPTHVLLVVVRYSVCCGVQYETHTAGHYFTFNSFKAPQTYNIACCWQSKIMSHIQKQSKSDRQQVDSLGSPSQVLVSLRCCSHNKYY